MSSRNEVLITGFYGSGFLRKGRRLGRSQVRKEKRSQVICCLDSPRSETLTPIPLPTILLCRNPDLVCPAGCLISPNNSQHLLSPSNSPNKVECKGGDGDGACGWGMGKWWLGSVGTCWTPNPLGSISHGLAPDMCASHRAGTDPVC